jgi:2-keto-4-pentenoate hydratase/2-oxohepta-3-ene-1,7-dioic acid hydratase in catechol pathway
MKLIRFGEPGKQRPGLIMEDAVRLDASSCVQDYDEAFFADDALSQLKQWLQEPATSAPRVAASVRLESPISPPSKIVCIGLNFRDHARRKQNGNSGRAGHIFQRPPRHWPARTMI